jgi:hypothetical protein
MEIIALGPKFSIIPTKGEIPMPLLIGKIERIVHQCPSSSQNSIRSEIVNIVTNKIVNAPIKSMDRDSRKLQENFMKTDSYIKFLNESENNIIITRADKGNLSCILNKEQYEEIADQLLSDTETYRPLDVDPTKRLTYRVKNFFLKKFLDLGVIDKKTFYRLTPSATNAPRVYFLPKLHKMKSPTDKLQARPVVSRINSPLCSLSKIITEILSKSFKSKYAVKNSFEFVDKLKKVKVPAGYTLISLDVQALFTCIPRYVFMDCGEKLGFD